MEVKVIKSKIIKKNMLEKINFRVRMKEDRNSDLENKLKNFTQFKEQREYI